MTDIELTIRKLDTSDPSLPLPSYETAQAAGLDLRADFGPSGTAIVLEPGAWALVPTGLAIALPTGYEAQLRPRSGLALKHGITLVNSPGTIDADYRGPLGIILINHGSTAFEVEHGARIAQMIIAPVVQAQIVLAETLSDTDRGTGGFGSTGMD